MRQGSVAPHPSPNHGPRLNGQAVDMLVLHYTGMETGAAAVARLCDPAAEVSSHYLIEENGQVLQLVPEHRRAWHAGLSAWRGHTDVNSRSIGIELVNPGHAWGYRPFTEAQIAALVPLCLGIMQRHGVAARNVVGHSDIAPDRKEDPGEFFPWQRMANAGVGLMPSHSLPHISQPALGAVQAGLAAFGYGVHLTGTLDPATRTAIVAFQRHFRSGRMDGVFDQECAALLIDLLQQAACEVPDGLLG